MIAETLEPSFLLEDIRVFFEDIDQTTEGRDVFELALQNKLASLFRFILYLQNGVFAIKRIEDTVEQLLNFDPFFTIGLQLTHGVKDLCPLLLELTFIVPNLVSPFTFDQVKRKFVEGQVFFAKPTHLILEIFNLLLFCLDKVGNQSFELFLIGVIIGGAVHFFELAEYQVAQFEQFFLDRSYHATEFHTELEGVHHCEGMNPSQHPRGVMVVQVRSAQQFVK